MRCFLSPEAWTETPVVLDASESKHAVKVLRKRVGDTLLVIDGQGRSAEARIEEASTERVVLSLGETKTVAPPRIRLAVVMAVLKESQMDWAIQKATELGAAEIHPVLTQHTVVRLAGAQRTRRKERWLRVAMGAAKQCGTPWLPDVREPASFDDTLRAVGTYDLNLYAALRGDSQPLGSYLEGKSPVERVAIWIGPEGDFSEEEDRQLREAGAVPVGLGPRVLRSETAALYAVSVLQSTWGGE